MWAQALVYLLNNNYMQYGWLQTCVCRVQVRTKDKYCVRAGRAGRAGRAVAGESTEASAVLDVGRPSVERLNGLRLDSPTALYI